MSNLDEPNEMIRITKELLALSELYPESLDDDDVDVESTKYWLAEAGTFR